MLLAMLAAYAGLTANGDMLSDDFLVAAMDQRSGWRMALLRMATWSPRPISESLLTIYTSCVVRLDRPLVRPAVLLVWALVFAMPLSSALLLARRCGSPVPIAVVLTITICMLTLTQPGEMFYWPAGAVAYLPSTFAIATVVIWQALGGRITTSGAAASHAVLLLVAAGSSELGALFVLLFTAEYGIQRALDGAVTSSRALFWWIIPGLLATTVLVLVLLNRLSTDLVLVSGTHHPESWSLSMLGAANVLAAEMPGLGGNGLGLDTSSDAFAVGVTVKSLLLLGFTWICPRAKRRALGALTGAALLATAFASIALALHRFGELCCGRQADMRQAMILLALLSIAPLLAPSCSRPRSGLGALLAAAIIGFIYRTPALVHDYQQQSAVVAARVATWQSGRQPGPSMIFYNSPVNLIANSGTLPPGVCLLTGKLQDCQAMLLFFHKRAMMVQSSIAR